MADDSGFGGTVMQYQVLLDPARLYGYHITVPHGYPAASASTTPMPAADSIRRAGSSITFAASGCFATRATSATWSSARRMACRCACATSAKSTIGSAPRLGEFGFNKTDDAVEGVILMLTRRADAERAEGRRGKNQAAERTHPAAGRESSSLTTTAAIWCG